MKLIHISDLHIGGGDAQLHGLEMLVKHLLANPVENASIIISGDIVDGRNGSEWVTASKVLKRLLERYRIIAVPGNHDISDRRGLTYDKRAADRTRFYINNLSPDFLLDKKGGRIFRHPDFKIIGLDTNIGQEGEFFPPLACGEIGDSQLAWLEVELQESIPTLIVMHHKVYCSDLFHRLEDRDKILALINRRDNVKAVCFGHLHEWSVVDRNGVQWIESDNTTISRRYRIIDTDDWSITDHKF